MTIYLPVFFTSLIHASGIGGNFLQATKQSEATGGIYELM